MYIKIIVDEFTKSNELSDLITNKVEKSVDGVDYIYGQVSASDFYNISISLAGGTYIVSDNEI
tara:strand:+ start:506 stop:694 length:189 start_codon:yes stop_codon:yes gene_type:complete